MVRHWWTYLQHSFPLYKSGMLAALLSASAIGYSMQTGMDDRSLLHNLGLVVLAWMSLWIISLQWQIAGDLSHHRQQRLFALTGTPTPALPAPALALEVLTIAGGAVQLGIVFSTGMGFVWLLVLLWGYIGLNRWAGFVTHWLKTYPWMMPLTYALLTALMALYGTAYHWLIAGTAMPGTVWRFILVCFCAGGLLDLGRSIREQQTSVGQFISRGQLKQTRQTLVLIWLAAVWLTSVAALVAAVPSVLVPVALLVLFGLTGSTMLAWRFLAHPTAKWANGLEWMSWMWTIGVCLSLGLLPHLG